MGVWENPCGGSLSDISSCDDMQRSRGSVCAVVIAHGRAVSCTPVFVGLMRWGKSIGGMTMEDMPGRHFYSSRDSRVSQCGGSTDSHRALRYWNDWLVEVTSAHIRDHHRSRAFPEAPSKTEIQLCPMIGRIRPKQWSQTFKARYTHRNNGL